MKYLAIINFVLFFALSAPAQNLVPNPGFERYDSCPSKPGQFKNTVITTNLPLSVHDWVNPTLASPDYFHACSDSNYLNVPHTYMGYHAAHNGEAIAGIVAYHYGPPRYREYITCKLKAPLLAGYKYDVSCYVQATCPNSNSTYAAPDQFHVLFTDIVIKHDSTSALNATDIVVLKNATQSFITDTITWAKIFGVYTAKGGEEWLTFGVFNTEPPPTVKIYPRNDDPYTGYTVYFMIDDMYVSDHIPCDTISRTHDTIICGTVDTSFIHSLVQDTTDVIFTWSTGDKSSRTRVQQPGTYWCRAQRDCHIYSDTFHVTIIADIVKKEIILTPCYSADGYLLETLPGGTDYRWNTADTTPAIRVTKGGIYVCSFTIHCISYEYRFRVLPYPKLDTVVQSLHDTIVCTDAPLLIGKEYDYRLKYRWNTGDTTCCIQPQKTGTYAVTVSDECGSVTDSAHVMMKDCTNCLFVPNAFTPNKDGLNDYFGVISSCDIIRFTMRIYNRWGQEIFTTNDINARWNGMYKADFAISGTYFYFIEYSTMYSNEPVLMKGDISLIR